MKNTVNLYQGDRAAKGEIQVSHEKYSKPLPRI